MALEASYGRRLAAFRFSARGLSRMVVILLCSENDCHPRTHLLVAVKSLYVTVLMQMFQGSVAFLRESS